MVNPAQPGLASLPAEIKAFRKDFPILETRFAHSRGELPLVYLDNAATSQKPQVVLDALQKYYSEYNSNIHRGAHRLAARATDAYEAARATVAEFIGCPDPALIQFTKGTTEGINLVASGLARSLLRPGDEVLLSGMEHHANIVPWQMACEQSGATLRVIPILPDGSLDLRALDELLGEKTRVLALVWMSNALGTVNPVEKMIRQAQTFGTQVLIDAAQAVVHFPIDVSALNPDYLVFSGHKVYGPTGTGVLYGRRERLEALPPYQGGGEMIREVRFEGTTYNELPYKFEAGTPNIAGAIGLGTALQYLKQQPRDLLNSHEESLLQLATEGLQQIPGIRFFGHESTRKGLLSFLVEGVHAYDLGVLMDQQGIAVRTGHHCCQPLMRSLGIEGTVRASFLPYNTPDEVERLVQAAQRAIHMLQQ